MFQVMRFVDVVKLWLDKDDPRCLAGGITREERRLQLRWALEQVPNPEVEDKARLDWMLVNGASVGHSSDGDYCRVIWSDRDGSYQTELHDNAREALDAAMGGEKKDYYREALTDTEDE